MLESLVDSSQMAEIDQLSETQYDISSETLMESAGKASAKEILSLPDLNTKCVLILCGPGNNGGDGLVLARYLMLSKVSVKCFCPQKSSSSLIQKKKDELNKLGHSLQSIENLDQIDSTMDDSTLIIDALFGIGLSKDITGDYANIINKVNQSQKIVVSLDVPSGLDPNTGQVKGVAVKAGYTLSFGLAKVGFYLCQGLTYTGQVRVLPLLFPKELLKEKSKSYFLVQSPWVSRHLPERKLDDNKSKQGHLLVLAGREGFFGAGYLATLAAYKMGVGYVTWASGESSPPIQNIPEVLTKKIADPDLFLNKTAVVIGPGLGVNEVTKNLILKLKKQNLSVVVDADAFTVCVKENLFPLPENWVVTPHSGELARLFGIQGKDVDQDRIGFAKKAFQKIGSLVLLKGLHSIIVDKETCFIVPTGNSALAKAGTGDVLSGFIGALMARSLPTFQATAVATFIHGKVADEWLQSGRDKDTLLAHEIAERLPFLLKQFRSS